jgi:hypothetical protein
MYGESMRWENTLKGQRGYKVDTGEEARLDGIMELAEALHDLTFVDLARTYAAFLVSHWDKQGIDIGAAVRTLRAMKVNTWFWNNTGRSIYRVLIDGLLSHIGMAQAPDWITLLEFPVDALEWTEIDKDRLGAGLDYYRCHGVSCDRDSRSDVSDLDELRGALKDLHERFGVDFAQIIASIETDLTERTRADDDDDERDGCSHEYSPSPADPVTEDDVREMFKTLKE